jgi:putative peptidoglycan lipid II flippase
MGEHKAIYGQIGKAVAVIMCLTVIDKLLAVVKEMLVAYRFGVSPALDVFNVAYALPSTIILFFSGAFGGAFIPVYLEWSHDSSTERADNHALALFYCASAFFGVLALIGFILSPVIFPAIGYGLAPEQKVLGIGIERLFMLLFLFEGTGVVLAGLLHAQKRFFNLYLAPTLINATVILFIVLGSRYGIHALVWGLLLGTFFKFAYTTVSLRYAGFRFFTGATFDREKLVYLGLLVLPLLGSQLIANSNILIDMMMATQLPAGSVSTLKYAGRINDLPIQVVIMAISRAIFPFASKQAIEKDYDGLRYMFKHSVTLLGFITFPIIALVGLFSSDIVALLLQRGAFDAHAAQQTAQTLVFYNIGLFFAAYTYINGVFFCALKETRLMLYLGCLSMVLNILFNFIFMHIFGVKGIALSTSVTLGIVCSVFFVLLKRKLHVTDLSNTFVQLFKIATASACMFAMGLAFRKYLGFLELNRFLGLTISGLFVTACYISLAWLFRIEEVKVGRELLGRMFGKPWG